MLSHVLANNPRVGYAHQTDLIGPATQNGQDYGYTLLDLINDMLSQYNSWYNTSPARPDDRRHRGPDAGRAGRLGDGASRRQGDRHRDQRRRHRHQRRHRRRRPRSPCRRAPPSTARPSASAYGGQLSDWVTLGTGATETLTEDVVPYPWTDSDVGSPEVAGSSSYDNGNFTVDGVRLGHLG